MRNKKLRSQRLFRWLLLLRAREALILLPAFGTSFNVVSAFVMSHKQNPHPRLAPWQWSEWEERPAFAEATACQA